MDLIRGRIALRVVLSFVLACAAGAATHAQSTWSDTYGGPLQDRAYRVQATADGGYLVLGSYVTAAGDWDGRLMKVGPTGAVTWAKSYGGPGDDVLYRMVASPDGGYFLGGVTASFGAGGDDVWIIKVDADGTPLWQFAYGLAGDDELEGMAVASDGGLYAAADVTLPDQGADVWAFKTDGSGNLVWSETIGGTGADYPRAVLALSSNRCAVLGFTNSFGFQDDRAWLLTLDGTGAVQSQEAFGMTGIPVYVDDACFSSDGGSFAVGTDTDVPAGTATQVLVVKLAATGIPLWQTSIGGDNTDECRRVIPTSDGGCLVVGDTWSFPGADSTDGWAARLSASGSIVWQERFSGPSYDYIWDAVPTSDGGFLLVGSKDEEGPDLGSAWLIKVKGTDGSMDSSCTFADPTAFAATSATGLPSFTSATPVAYLAQQAATDAAGETVQVAATQLCSSVLTCTLEGSADVPGTCTVGLPVSFQATVSAGNCADLPTFAWDFGDGATSTAQNPTHTYATTGSFDWTLEIADEGQSVASSGTITSVAGPVVAAIKKVAPPFSIAVKGSNFQSGIQVFIDGNPWPQVTYKNSGKIKLTGGKALKAVVPKGVTTTFRFVNPDGGEAEQTWSW